MPQSEKEIAQTAIFDGIRVACAELAAYGPVEQASILRDLAVAYRLAAGGPQPGGSIVDGRS